MTTKCHGHGRNFIHLSEGEVWKAIAENTGGAADAEVTGPVADLTVRLMTRAEQGRSRRAECKQGVRACARR